MKAMPTDDPLFGKGMIRADGRHMHQRLSDEGEIAGGIEGPMGRLQDGLDHRAGRRVPAA